MTFLLVPLMLIAAFALVATWTSGRAHRHPHRSVRSFSRALDAIEPRVGDAARSTTVSGS